MNKEPKADQSSVFFSGSIASIGMQKKEQKKTKTDRPRGASFLNEPIRFNASFQMLRQRFGSGMSLENLSNQRHGLIAI